MQQHEDMTFEIPCRILPESCKEKQENVLSMVQLTFHKHFKNQDAVFSWAHLQLVTESKLRGLLTKQNE